MKKNMTFTVMRSFFLSLFLLGCDPHSRPVQKNDIAERHEMPLKKESPEINPKTERELDASSGSQMNKQCFFSCVGELSQFDSSPAGQFWISMLSKIGENSLYPMREDVEKTIRVTSVDFRVGIESLRAILLGDRVSIVLKKWHKDEPTETIKKVYSRDAWTYINDLLEPVNVQNMNTLRLHLQKGGTEFLFEHYANDSAKIVSRKKGAFQDEEAFDRFCSHLLSEDVFEEMSHFQME
ncbi:MAG: hypothetical protein JXR76_02210 [Deltaproteobacteria bacterium]|nr:hypothetical protein [Deltaproteobacteria bacterium]